MRIEVGDRVALKGHSNVYGTVKYFGQLMSVDGIWVGVDWDDDSRGKHDGLIKGVRYFTARYETSASFVKPDVLNFATDLIEEIVKKYVYGGIDEVPDDDRWEFIEMEKINKQQRDFINLRCIVLTNTLVTHVNSKFKNKFLHCFELDLTGTLLNKWCNLFKILELFPMLKTLHLGYTYMEKLDDDYMPSELDLPQLSELSFNGAHLDNEMANKITTIFPNLKEIYLAYNGLTFYSPLVGCSYLATVDLQHNHITSFLQVSTLFYLPNLIFLNLSGCGLKEILLPSGDVAFPKLATLTIADNPIAKWRCVEELARMPMLRKLVLRGCHLIGVCGVDVRELIIAKIPNLIDLDRCDISPLARRSAELYVLSRLSHVDVSEEHSSTIERLKKAYNVEETSLKVDESVIRKINGSALNSKKIYLTYKSKSLQRNLPLTLSIHRLVGLASKLFHFDPDDINYVELRHSGFPPEKCRRTKDILLDQFDLENEDFISFIE